MKNKYYAVTMRRNIGREEEFILGIFTKMNKAQKEGEKYSEYRGGKYDTIVSELILNIPKDLGQLQKEGN